MIHLPNNTKPPAALLPWLSCPDSLTEMLNKKAGQHRLERLKQEWIPADDWIMKKLGSPDEKVLQREIVMYAGNVPCWYARTIIPKTTFESDSAFFLRLKRESLGELVFHSSQITRASLVYYPINRFSPEYHWVNDLHSYAEVLWVRQSEFFLMEHHPFFLFEILLPTIERYSN